jgi:molecular chaperone HtpG
MNEPATQPERHEFRAGVSQLLDILVHSVYTAKDIFIRELISNAADALEKARFLEVQGGPLHPAEGEPRVEIETGEADGRKYLSISDNGIGMTAGEVRENIGTIAHSGARAFLEQMQQEGGQGVDLIGRFGIGFYSVFMVAEEVVLTTRSAQPDQPAVEWRSDGRETYQIRLLDEERPRGTEIRVFLRSEEERFADPQVVSEAIERYSRFVPFPVKVEGEQKNRTRALWREPASQVSDEEYAEFYRYVAQDTADPLLHMHVSADAPIQYSALLFVPQTDPEVLGFGQGEVAVQLYVKRVLIDAESKDLLPKFLRFARGVVDCEDLPLNISRESLQENAVIRKVRDGLTRKLLDRLQELARDERETYEQFWRSFGRILKEGYDEFRWHEKLSDLLLFNSSHHDDEEPLTSLAEYLERKPEQQKAIYFMSGASRAALEHDPRLELFRKKGVEVLYLTDVADELVLARIESYSDTPLKSADQVAPEELEALGTEAAGDASSGDGDGDDEDAREDRLADRSAVDPLLSAFKSYLGERVIDVVVSERLVDSPACLVNPEGRSAYMDKLIRMIQKDADLPRRTLEINPKHPMIRHLAALAREGGDEEFLHLACEQLFEGAMLVDGYLTDPHQLVERMNRVLGQAAAAKAPE